MDLVAVAVLALAAGETRRSIVRYCCVHFYVIVNNIKTSAQREFEALAAVEKVKVQHQRSLLCL